MPKASKESASRVEDMGVMEGRYEELGGYTVGFETFREDADGEPVLKGLPDDRCQSEHWGYVVSGSITFRFADHEETYETGDAYYAPYLQGYDNHPMWNADPRYLPFKESLKTSHLHGWPGPAGQALSESNAKYVLVDMFAKACRGDSTKDVIATAAAQLKQIYKAK